MKSLWIIGLLLLPSLGVAQQYSSTKSKVTFFSEALIEDITATNDKSRSVIDTGTGKIAFSIPINGFKFRKSLMQEHFNDKYLESDKFPKSTFSATLVDFEKGKNYDEIIAEGELEIHGVKKNVQLPGSIEYKGEKMLIHCVFTVLIADYDIKIPTLMFQNIAEEIEITVDFEYDTNEK